MEKRAMPPAGILTVEFHTPACANLLRRGEQVLRLVELTPIAERDGLHALDRVPGGLARRLALVHGMLFREGMRRRWRIDAKRRTRTGA